MNTNTQRVEKETFSRRVDEREEEIIKLESEFTLSNSQYKQLYNLVNLVKKEYSDLVVVNGIICNRSIWKTSIINVDITDIVGVNSFVIETSGYKKMKNFLSFENVEFKFICKQTKFTSIYNGEEDIFYGPEHQTLTIKAVKDNVIMEDILFNIGGNRTGRTGSYLEEYVTDDYFNNITKGSILYSFKLTKDQIKHIINNTDKKRPSVRIDFNNNEININNCIKLLVDPSTFNGRRLIKEMNNKFIKMPATAFNFSTSLDVTLYKSKDNYIIIDYKCSTNKVNFPLYLTSKSNILEIVEEE